MFAVFLFFKIFSVCFVFAISSLLFGYVGAQWYFVYGNWRFCSWFSSPAHAECWAVDSEIPWGPSCFPRRIRLRKRHRAPGRSVICNSPGRSIIVLSLKAGGHQVGPEHDEKAGKVVCAWPKSIEMIQLRLRRPKGELFCFRVGFLPVPPFSVSYML